MGCLAGVLMALGLATADAAAQASSAVPPWSASGRAALRTAAPPPDVAPSAPPLGLAAPPSIAPRPPQAHVGPSPLKAALLSAVLPGAGQHVLGQRRKWAYLALESVGWLAWASRRSSAMDLRSRYRDFAWMEARLQLEPRVEGDFDYYETLTKWQRSGLFDVDPDASGLQPESDETTYNGMIWGRATQLHLQGLPSVPETDPRYQRALDYYRERAYEREFLWDWTGTGAAQQEFASLIRRSDDRFRQATNVLGLVLANHLVSMVDAFVSARAPGTTVRSGFTPSGAAAGVSWSTRVRVETPW